MTYDFMTLVPDDEMVFAPMLAEWHRRANAGDVLPLEAAGYEPGSKEPGWVGASKLGGCIRQLGYMVEGVKGADFDEEGLHSTGIGTLVHLAIQAVAKDTRDVQIEQRWELPELKIASHADIVDEELDEVVDIKTIAPFGFKMKRSNGPERGHFVQVQSAAEALGREFCRLVYICPGKLAGRDIPKGHKKGDRATIWAEFTWRTEAGREAMQIEYTRLDLVRQFIAEGEQIPRFIPGAMPPGARIVDVGTPGDKAFKAPWQLYSEHPDTGEPVMIDTGTTFHCAYCDFQHLCAAELKDDDAPAD